MDRPRPQSPRPSEDTLDAALTIASLQARLADLQWENQELRARIPPRPPKRVRRLRRLLRRLRAPVDALAQPQSPLELARRRVTQASIPSSIAASDESPNQGIEVVIVTRDRLDGLRATLSCLGADDDEAPPMTVIDRGSIDGTRAFLRARERQNFGVLLDDADGESVVPFPKIEAQRLLLLHAGVEFPPWLPHALLHHAVQEKLAITWPRLTWVSDAGNARVITGSEVRWCRGFPTPRPSSDRAALPPAPIAMIDRSTLDVESEFSPIGDEDDTTIDLALRLERTGAKLGLAPFDALADVPPPDEAPCATFASTWAEELRARCLRSYKEEAPSPIVAPLRVWISPHLHDFAQQLPPSPNIEIHSSSPDEMDADVALFHARDDWRSCRLAPFVASTRMICVDSPQRAARLRNDLAHFDLWIPFDEATRNALDNEPRPHAVASRSWAASDSVIPWLEEVSPCAS